MNEQNSHKAVEAYQAALDIDPEEIFRSLLTSMSLFSLGRQPEANAELERFIENYQAFWAYQVAEAYSWRNEPDNAFQWLEAATQYRDPGLSNILTDALFTNIHSDPRWEPFLAKKDVLDAWREMPDKYKAPGR
jgi:adenylate cyclase